MLPKESYFFNGKLVIIGRVPFKYSLEPVSKTRCFIITQIEDEPLLTPFKNILSLYTTVKKGVKVVLTSIDGVRTEDCLRDYI